MKNLNGMTDSDFSETQARINLAVERCTDDQLVELADALHERARARRRARFGEVQMNDLIIIESAPHAMSAG